MTSNDDTEQSTSASLPLASTKTPADNAPDQTLSALDDLESLLSDKHDLPEAPDGAPVLSVPVIDPHAAAGAPSAGEHGIEHDGQYTIPLLEDVVKPGLSMPPVASDPPVTLSPMAQRLFDRLASEIDVIVQTGVDDALKAAARDIRKRVKQHVAIVLPEILDELANGDDSEF